MSRPSKEFVLAYETCALLHGLTEGAQYWWDSSNAHLRRFIDDREWEARELVDTNDPRDFSRWNNAWAKAFLSQFEGEQRDDRRSQGVIRSDELAVDSASAGGGQ